MSSDFDPIWTSLLTWLDQFDNSVVEQNTELVHNSAGRGLVARTDLPPSSLLISIPNQALLNLQTLIPLYPPAFTQDQLNATQLLSLHLALQFRKHLFSPPPKPTKGKGKEKDNRDKYWPFIASLPRSFPSHPLTWWILSKSHSQLKSTYGIDEEDLSVQEKEEIDVKRRKRYGKLLELMGRGLRTRVDKIEERFRKDWREVQRVWNENKLGEDERFGFFDFLLGWLNVNTRCIYFDLPSSVSTKKENNLTLAPVIDMINHRPSLQTCPHPTTTALTFSTPSRSSPDAKVKKGEELAFSYGGHDDPFLLSEYGFIIGNGDQGNSKGNEYNSLNVDRYIEGLFESQGEEGKLKIGVLKDADYWGDMTFQSHPPSPSWRVLIALRLLHLRLPSHSSLGLSSESLAPFYDLLSGSIDQISHLNEKKVQASLKAIGKNLWVECEEGVKRCDETELEWFKEGEKCLGDEEKREVKELREWLKMIREIWKGEEEIAKGISEE